MKHKTREVSITKYSDGLFSFNATAWEYSPPLNVEIILPRDKVEQLRDELNEILYKGNK